MWSCRPAAMLLAVLAGACALGCDEPSSTSQASQPLSRIRIGYFANVTHAQAVLGVWSGELGQALAPARLETKVFNAGPSLIEALFAGEIDIGYVGPGPALSAFARSKGEGIRVISGAAANGVLIVARKDSGIATLADLPGKKIASPQHGNTQDIAARHYLISELKQPDANDVLAIANSEQPGLMGRGQIDAAWAPEPWGSRLIVEVGATLIAEEKNLWPGKEFALTVVVTTPRFLAAHPEAIDKVLGVHRQWTRRLQEDAPAHADALGAALAALTGKKLPPGVLSASLKHVKFTDDPLPATFSTMAQWAYDLGFAAKPPALESLFVLKLPRS